MAYVINRSKCDMEWEEPCMRCCNQIRYNESDIIHGFIDSDSGVGDYIICPSCDSKMRISRTWVALC